MTAPTVRQRIPYCACHTPDTDTSCDCATCRIAGRHLVDSLTGRLAPMAQKLVKTADHLNRTPELRASVVQMFADVDRLLESGAVRLDVVARDGLSVLGTLFTQNMRTTLMFDRIVSLYRDMTQTMRNFGNVIVNGYASGLLRTEPLLRYEFSMAAVNPVSAVFPTAELGLVDRHAYVALLGLIETGQFAACGSESEIDDEFEIQLMADLQAAHEQNGWLRQSLSETQRRTRAVQIAQAGGCTPFARGQRLAGTIVDGGSTPSAADAQQ